MNTSPEILQPCIVSVQADNPDRELLDWRRWTWHETYPGLMKWVVRFHHATLNGTQVKQMNCLFMEFFIQYFQVLLMVGNRNHGIYYKHTPASGPLHLLCLVLKMFFSKCPCVLLPRSFAFCPLPSWVLLKPHCLKLQFPLMQYF